MTNRPPSRAGTLLEVFLAKKEAAGRSPSTARNYRHSIERFLAAATTPADPAEWSDLHVDLWLAAMRKAGQAPASIEHHRKHLHAFLGFLVKRDEIADFRDRIEEITVPKATKRTATIEDIIKLQAAALLGRHPERDAAIIATIWSSGIRLSECAALDYDSLDLGNGLIHLQAPDTKRKIERIGIILPPAKAALLEWLLKRGTGPGPLWTTVDGGRFSVNGIAKMLAYVSERAEVKISAHDIRRGFASRMLAAGIDPVHVARLGGWESLEVMTEYAEAVRTEAALAATRRMA